MLRRYVLFAHRFRIHSIRFDKLLLLRSSSISLESTALGFINCFCNRRQIESLTLKFASRHFFLFLRGIYVTRIRGTFHPTRSNFWNCIPRERGSERRRLIRYYHFLHINTSLNTQGLSLFLEDRLKVSHFSSHLIGYWHCLVADSLNYHFEPH